MKQRNIFFWLLLPFAVIFTGCASYNAAPLSVIQENVIQKEGVTVSGKLLNKLECKTYFDRNIIGKGYQPIQIAVSNNSDKTYVLRRSSIDLPLASAEWIAGLVHTSTIGRALGYGVGGVFIPLLFIPAVVDGFSSAEANKRLDTDFHAKALADVHMIPPHVTLNKVIFVPMNQRKEQFVVQLTDAATQDVLNLEVRTPVSD